jgi:four helix bundle protein
VLKSGTSAGANYEEADGGSSARDKLAKKKIVPRELMETKFRLRVLRRTGFLSQAQDPVINETDELIKIVATIIRNDTSPDSWELGVRSSELTKEPPRACGVQSS